MMAMYSVPYIARLVKVHEPGSSNNTQFIEPEDSGTAREEARGTHREYIKTSVVPSKCMSHRHMGGRLRIDPLAPTTLNSKW